MPPAYRGQVYYSIEIEHCEELRPVRYRDALSTFDVDRDGIEILSSVPAYH